MSEDNSRAATDTPDSRATSAAPSVVATPHPKLKIKLRLGGGGGASASGAASQASTSAAATPNKRPARRSAKRKRTPSEDEIESEGGESEGDYFNSGLDDDDDEGADTQRAPRLTARQAVLAGGKSEDLNPSEHVMLPLENTTRRGKKATLTAGEIALKREESARKRRNLTEKKLEDEKQDTINRLLRKQGRRGAAVKEEEEEEEEDGEEGDEVIAEAEVYETGPPMYRWISSAKGVTFSVPEAWLPVPPEKLEDAVTSATVAT
ncbi:PAPA-1-like conserved region-domain-containing protein [Auriculariales sp. MPI-PUGE-AT-0066]|nr:PAPA-1-like conserved region-domain-containing protein [Auriculariales sp. MPI-PUGE-AT-0066]